MTQTAVAPLENTVHTTNAWLKELMKELCWTDRRQAYHALRVVLHSLRDRLTTEEVADLGAQLPMMIRGLFYEGWRPAGTHVKVCTRDDFLAPIAEAFRHDVNIYADDVVMAVFKVLRAHVSAGEIADVKGILRKQIRSLWPDEGGERES